MIGRPPPLPVMMPKFAAAAARFQPGSRWTYSPLAGFDTLGRVVEVASGMSFRSVPERAYFPGPRHEDPTAFHPGDIGWSKRRNGLSPALRGQLGQDRETRTVASE